MINLDMINEIKSWGFDIEKEYHMTKAHDGIIGIKDRIVTAGKIADLYTEYSKYLDFGYLTLMEKLETEAEYIGDYKIYTKYKLYHEDAEELVILGDYLNDEYIEYLEHNDITSHGLEASDIEEFFEQYGIEVY